jgi:hypothetical protein
VVCGESSRHGTEQQKEQPVDCGFEVSTTIQILFVAPITCLGTFGIGFYE